MFSTAKKMYVTVSAGFMIGCCAEIAFAQGSLTPPPGTPGPSMKSLAQVEPRTAITNVPYTITQPGSYYLTTNFATAGSGVIIQANRVTVDLMGFSLMGDNDAIGYGVWVSGQSANPRREVVIRGGSITGFDSGIYFEYVQNGRVEEMAISGNVNQRVLL